MEVKIHKEELTLEQKKEVKECYKIFTDKYKDGLLRVADLKIAMMGLGLSPTNDEIERIITQLKLFKKMDKNDELVTLTFYEFYDIIHFRLISKKFSFDNESRKMFLLLSNGKEIISNEDIQYLNKHFDDKKTPEQIEKLYKVSDVDNDGKITQKDFVDVLRHSNYQ